MLPLVREATGFPATSGKYGFLRDNGPPEIHGDDMKRTFPCGCGCKTPTTPNMLVPVTVQYREQHPDRPEIITVGKRFMVAKACQVEFQREQNTLVALRDLAILCGAVTWWRRLEFAIAIYTAKVEIERRLKGRPKARQLARRCVLVTIAPDWLAERLVRRWNPRPVAAPPVPAILGRELPSVIE